MKQQRKHRIILAALVALTGLALAACGAGRQTSISQGTAAPSPTVSPAATEMMMEGSPQAMEFDLMFIDMMAPHHQSAIEMARIAEQRAEHAEIKELAGEVIRAQQAEIDEMRQWRQQWYGSSDTPPMSAMPMLVDMPGMGGAGHTVDMTSEVERLRDAPEPFDLAFIDAMIPHHQTAIEAARMAEQQAKRQEIKDLAMQIIEAQQREIDQLQGWRQTWYPDAEPAPTATP